MTIEKRKAQIKKKAQKNLNDAIKERKILSDDFGDLMSVLQSRGAIKSISFNKTIVLDINAISKSKGIDPSIHSVLRNSFYGALYSEAGQFCKTEKELTNWFKFEADPNTEDGWSDGERKTLVNSSIFFCVNCCYYYY